MQTRIHTWVHVVNLNFGKTNPCVHCIYICFVDLRSSPLDTCVLESLLFCVCKICVNLLKELHWADSTIGVWIYIYLLALLLLCSLCSEWTWKFRINKPGSFEFTYCLAQPGSSEFGSQWILSAAFEWKFVGAPIHPPSRRHQGPLNWYQSLASHQSLITVKKWCRRPMRYPLSHL